MADAVKLEPCPFCGNQNPVYWCYTNDGRNLFTDRWAVLCYYPDGGCGAEGSHQKSKEEAAAAWNERQPKIVRCKDCKHGKIYGIDVECVAHEEVGYDPEPWHPLDWFCADGEKRQ